MAPRSRRRVTGDATLRSRGTMCPGFANPMSPKREGAGNAGAQVAPAASCARVESTRVSHHRYAETSGIPCTMGLRLIRALPGVPGLIATVARDNRLAGLTPASGGQDHTAWPSAGKPSSARKRAELPRVHRIPLPTSVTIAIRPSDGGGMSRRKPHVSEKRKENIFARAA